MNMIDLISNALKLANEIVERDGAGALITVLWLTLAITAIVAGTVIYLRD